MQAEYHARNNPRGKRPHGKPCHDIIIQNTKLIRETPNASSDSVFIRSPLPPLSAVSPACPRLSRKPVRIINGDTFAVTRQLMCENTHAVGNIAVLNLASGQSPAGAWNGLRTSSQEEALCYSSTLYATLKPEYYPWSNHGAGSCVGVFSPGVAITRHNAAQAVLPVNERQVVSVISVAAQRFPKLTNDSTRSQTFRYNDDLLGLRGKIRLIYRMAAGNGKTFLVLGALGCGVYKCPPYVVAREMKAVLEEGEFDGWFEQVMFAIFGAEPKPGHTPGAGIENFRIFKEVFEGR